ncbi:transmembrane protein 68 isoform X4 [Papio anubis]|uniref:transmembrane protein 68 isoform X5 n=1 Tax=Cercocebus atys TaxID=9531 RepID=UPI0001D55F63|nr:PREDICTED: transmembrane protein 68 isoform X5 [Cercocebus atys]XP_031525426.1 transmembrane protein 68 isoform X4 [Papio anubis]XP_031525427.1 transmembrane protein 68 isoform X4 [Papio anubis]
MIDKNQTCGLGQDSVPYMLCLIHILEEWFGVEQLEDYLNFANYLLWVFTPLILLILPYFTIFLLYLTIIFLHIYKRKNVLKEAYSHNLWDGARKTVATLWDGHAAVWHGKQGYFHLCVAIHMCCIGTVLPSILLIEKILKNTIEVIFTIPCYLFACIVHMHVSFLK